MMKIIPVVVLIGWTSALAFQPELRKFHIKEVRGQVLAWQPWANVWTPIKTNERIWENTLVQIGKNSSLTFSLEFSEGFRGMQSDAADYTINVPMILRLAPGIPRKIKLDDFFIPKLPDVSKAEGAEKESLYHSFTEAWQRFAANVLPQDIKKYFVKKAVEENVGISVAMKAKKIRIFYPSDEAVSITDRMPDYVRVVWKQVPEAGVEYGVRVWEEQQLRPEPLGYTTQDYYSVKVPKEGKYLVQVATKDGRWQSEVRRFSVALPMSGRGQPPSRTAVIKPLPLEFPPKSFVYYVKGFPVSLTFIWSKPNSAKGTQIYHFTLADSLKRPLYERKMTDESVTIKFTEPGSYKWFLTAVPANPDDPEDQSKIVYSEVRELSLKKYDSPNRNLAGDLDSLDKMISFSQSGVYYLSEGF